RIRTSGPCVPNTVLYQAELHSDRPDRRYRPGAAIGQVLGRSVGALDGEVDGLGEGAALDGIRENSQRFLGQGTVGTGPFDRAAHGMMGRHERLRAGEVGLALLEILDGAMPELALLGAARLIGENDGKRHLAFPEIVADALAELGLAGGIVERVVDELEGDAEIEPEPGERLFLLG